ncbi:MAG: hypothetical protein KF875_12035 [Trueperaceae bacterium]|nr:hypothetical protein [Trueperaceae bacterium]MCW5818480.1 hypothetical protein [Trueperaceae bacterium]
MTPLHPLTTERRERLSVYLDGELAPDEVAVVESELDTDPVSRAYLNDLKVMSNSLRVDDDDRQAADAIRAEVRRRLGSRTLSRRSGLKRWGWPAIAAGFAVAALVAVSFRMGTAMPSRESESVQLEAVVLQYGLALEAISQEEP